MAYVEHEWVNGETITAAKLNNIEEGIVEASQSGGGGGNPIIFITKDFNSADHFLDFAICAYDSGEEVYVALENFVEDGTYVNINIGGYSGSGFITSPLPVPPEGYYLVVWGASTWTYEFSGDIDPNTIPVSYGSIADAHIITGNCSISITE